MCGGALTEHNGGGTATHKMKKRAESLGWPPGSWLCPCLFPRATSLLTDSLQCHSTLQAAHLLGRYKGTKQSSDPQPDLAVVEGDAASRVVQIGFESFENK